MWSNHAFLFLQEPLVHKQLSLITKTSLRALDDSQLHQGLGLEINNSEFGVQKIILLAMSCSIRITLGANSNQCEQENF
jgi:hypothetical protein